MKRVLKACDGSRTVAALVLGMHRRTLQRVLSRGGVTMNVTGFSGPGRQSRIRTRTGESTMPSRSLDGLIGQIISELAKQVAQAVRAELAKDLRGGASAPSTREVKRTAVPGRKTSKPAARSLPPHCVYPGCTNAHRGPRFSFLCQEHVGISQAEKKKYLEAWKAARKGSPPEKAAAPKPAGEKSGRRGRRGALDEATVTRVLKVVEDNPGLRSEEIYRKLPLKPDLAKKALAKLRADKRVKTTGEKRGMTYAAA